MSEHVGPACTKRVLLVPETLMPVLVIVTLILVDQLDFLKRRADINCVGASLIIVKTIVTLVENITIIIQVSASCTKVLTYKTFSPKHLFI